MFASRNTRITIELDLSGSEVAGVLHGSAGRRSFDGWLELTAALERADSDARFAASGTARRAARRRAAAMPSSAVRPA